MTRTRRVETNQQRGCPVARVQVHADGLRGARRPPQRMGRTQPIPPRCCQQDSRPSGPRGAPHSRSMPGPTTPPMQTTIRSSALPSACAAACGDANGCRAATPHWLSPSSQLQRPRLPQPAPLRKQTPGGVAFTGPSRVADKLSPALSPDSFRTKPRGARFQPNVLWPVAIGQAAVQMRRSGPAQHRTPRRTRKLPCRARVPMGGVDAWRRASCRRKRCVSLRSARIRRGMGARPADTRRGRPSVGANERPSVLPRAATGRGVVRHVVVERAPRRASPVRDVGATSAANHQVARVIV